MQSQQPRVMHSTNEPAFPINGYPFMNTQWTCERTQSSLSPFLHGGAFNDTMSKFAPASPSIGPCTNIRSSHLYQQNSNRNAQIRLQAQHIDSAIQLLKMQYDAIMASVQMSGYDQQHRPSAITSPQESRAFKQQMTFDAQFDLSGAESVGDQEPASISRAATASSCHKRGSDSAPLKEIMGIMDQPTANSTASSAIRSAMTPVRAPSPQQAKRPRLQ